jgi:hypothetical protein
MIARPYLAVFAVLSLSTSASTERFSQGTTAPADAKPTTIIGCLVQGRPSVDGKVADRNDFFIRTPTVKIPPGATVAVGSPGTTSTATSIGTPVEDSFYRVTSLSAEQLRPHLGHRVELQGRLTDNTPGIEGSRATTTQDKEGRATTTVETRIEVAGVLHATTVKMVSAGCK